MRLKLFKLSSRSRLSLGMSMIVVCLTMTATTIGWVPDETAAIMRGRSALSESLALQSRSKISERSLREVQQLLESVVARNEDLHSAGLRRADGELVLTIADHSDRWNLQTEAIDDRQVFVPLHTDAGQWGRIELCFAPIRATTWWNWIDQPQYRLIGWMGLGSLIGFQLYLWMMLRQIDVKNVAPDRVREAYSKMADGVILVNKVERIVLANESFARSVGRPVESLVGKRLSDLPWIGAGRSADASATGLDQATTELPWTRAIRGDVVNQSDVLGFDAGDGRRPTFTVGCSVFREDDGGLKGLLISLSDVTELEDTKRELSLAKEHAEAANQAKSSFLANMSHEIRTPMNAVLGFTDILRRGIEHDPSKCQKYLNTIHASGSHLLSLINDILDLSKVEAGRMEVESVACQPHQIVCDVFQVLEAPARKKGLTLSLDCPHDVPRVIHSDPARLRQVLINLVGNAIKFTHQGGVKIVVDTRVDAGQLMYLFRIIDTGIGLSSAAMSRIFTPFSQADASVTRKYGGTGLGLSISQRFARALGGDIEVHSELGHGSVFTVTIAAGETDSGDWFRPTLQELESQSVAPENSQIRLPAMNVLLVDDGEENRDLISIILEEAGVKFVTAENGLQAIQAAGANRFDVILMDMQMPVMDGYTAARTLRDRGDTTPIIALTAHAMQGDQDKCFAAGCSHFMTKPIDIDRLIQTLTQIAAAAGLVATDPGRPGNTARPGAATTPREGDAAESSTTVPHRGPIHSTLPTSNPKFRQIVSKFSVRLPAMIDAIDAACRDQDQAALKNLSHALKGTSANCGFGQLSKLAATLESQVPDMEMELLLTTIGELRQLQSLIVDPSEPIDTAEQSFVDTPAATDQTKRSPRGPSHRSLRAEDLLQMDLSLGDAAIDTSHKDVAT